MTWDAPLGCPTSDAVQSRIRELLGSAADKATHLHAQGQIVRIKRGRFRLTLTTVDEAGAASHRVIESNSCSDLAGAAAVALGLWMRFELSEEKKSSDAAKQAGPTAEQNANTAQRPEEASSSEASTASEPTAAGKPADSESGSPTRREPDDSRHAEPLKSVTESGGDSGAPGWRPMIHGPLIGVELGPLPSLRPTAGLALGMRRGHWRAWLGIRGTLGETVWAVGEPRNGAQLRRVTGELRGCYGFGEQLLEIGPCLLFAIDRITATGVGEEISAQTSEAYLFAPGLGALGNLHVMRSLSLVVSIGAQVETSRPRLFVDGLGEIQQLAPFGLTAHIGAEWNF